MTPARFSLPRTYERLLVRAPFEFRRERVALPASGGADYVVRVDACGLCRSDLHAASTWATDWQELGHEFGGTVVAVQRSDARFAVGDRVAVRNAAPCGACVRCREGAVRACQHLVVNMQGFRDYALCDERSLVDASALDDDLLALVEPTNVALDLLHSACLAPSHHVTVLGSGTLGLLTAWLVLHVWKIPRLIVVGRSPRSLLADALELPAYMSLEARVPHADRVLVTTPPSTLERALAICRHGGQVITVGLDDTERCRVSLDAAQLIFGQRTLRGVCAAPNSYFEEAVAVLRQHGAALRPLIARRTVRADLEDALQAWHTRPHYDGKTIVIGGAGARS